MDDRAFIRSHPILGLATPSGQEALVGVMTAKGFERGSTVVRPGSPHTHVFIVQKGTLEVSRRNKEAGTQMLIGLMEAPGILGDAELYAGNVRWEVTVRAASRVRAQAIPDDFYRAWVVQEGRVAAALYHDAAARLMLTLELMQVFALQKTSNKILRLLWAHSISRPGTDERVAPFSRANVARALGLNAKTVSRNVDALESQGLISRRGTEIVLNVDERGAFAGRFDKSGLNARWQLPRAGREGAEPREA